MRYYITKVEEKTEEGKIKKYVYLVHAVSCTDAEARITKHLGTGMGEFEVVSVAESPIIEVIEE